MDTSEDQLPVEDVPKVFLSYSRRDREQAQRIADVLRGREFSVFRDTDDILPTEEWKDRLQQLIESADTIVFLLSPHSARSEVCAWEVEIAESLNKRIAPVVIDDVDSVEIPETLKKLNYIFCTERNRIEEAVDTLVSALNLNIDWIREHTRLNSLAGRWQQADRSNHLLLRGRDIRDAETWRDNKPSKAPIITKLQASFVAVSRIAAVRRRKLAVAASLAGMLVAIGLAWLANFQWTVAVENEKIAIQNEQRANDTRDDAWSAQSEVLTDWANEATETGDRTTATLLLLAALPDRDAVQSRVDNARPLFAGAEEALFHNHFYGQEVAVLDQVPRSDGAPPWIQQVLFGPSGKLLLTLSYMAGKAAAIQIWDVETAGLLGEKIINDGPVKTMAFAPNGESLIVLLENQRALMLNPATGKETFRFTGCLANGETDWGQGRIIFSDDGKRFATAGYSLCIWNVDTGKVEQRVKPTSANDPFANVAFSNDERYLFYTSYRNALVSNIETGRQLILYPGVGRVGLSFNEARTKAIVTDLGSTILPPGAPIPADHKLPSTLLLDLINPGLVTTLSDTEALTLASFSPDGQSVISSQGNRIKIWDGKTGTLNPTPGEFPKDDAYFVQNDALLRYAGYTPDGTHIYAPDYHGTLKIWDLKGQMINQIFKPRETSNFYPSYIFGPKFNHFVSYTRDTAVTLWKASAPKHLKHLDDHLDAIGRDVIDAQTRGEIAEHFRQRSDAKFRGLDWPSRDVVMASTARQPRGGLKAEWVRNQSTSVLISNDQGNEQSRIVTPGYPVQSVAFRNGSTVVAIAGSDGVLIVDALSGQAHATVAASALSGLPYRARSVLYSEDGKHLIVISEDYIDIFDATTTSKIASFMSEDTIINTSTPADYFDTVENRFVEFMMTDLQPQRWKHGKDDLRPRFWRMINLLQDLVAYEKATAPRCLSKEQQRRYFLGDTPPRWCITGNGDSGEREAGHWQPLHPYRAAQWKDWLTEYDQDPSAAVPVE